MDKIDTIAMVIVIIVLISIFGILGILMYTYIDYGVKEGEVIDKEYHASYISTEYRTITTGNTSTTIPVQQFHPESYTIKIQKEDGAKLKAIWIEVTAQEYKELKIGDYYGK